MDRRDFIVRSAGIVGAAGVAGALLSCGGDGDGVTDTDGGDGGGFDGTITLTAGLAFDPPDVTIAVGDTVTWESEANIFHTITPDGHSEWTRQEMNSAGDTFTHTFDNAGTFDYFCEPHQAQGMVGSITVQ